MSTATRVERDVQERTLHHLGSLGALAVLTLTYLSVLYDATTVAGGTWLLVGVAVIAFVAAIILSRSVSERRAMWMAGVAFVVSGALYLHVVPGGWDLIWSFTGGIRDSLALMTGYSILSIVGVELWIAAVAPGPIFLSWYLAMRSRFVSAAAIGSVPLLFVILTGDISTELALIGVLSAASVVGLGDLARMRADVAYADLLAIILALMLVASLAVSVVPGGGAEPITPEGGVGGSGTTEAAIIGADEEMSVSGNPSLSPEVRYTIEADEPANWRVDAYDRYTGEGWIQTGERQAFAGGPAPFDAEETSLTVRTEVSGLTAMPAQWEPRIVIGQSDVTETPEDGLVAEEGMPAGQTFEVISGEPSASPQELAEAGTDYPDHIEERYTQLPGDTPDRVGELTADLIAEEESPYEAAQTIEQYVIETNEYSLDVEAPEGDIADEQLFERDQGYCVFFATTMVVMLRSQDMPARMVTGYSPGERVAEDRWVVRGMNAHAWVELYVQGEGWVEFDPTPSAPYNDVREQRLEEAREEGVELVDTDESGGPEWEPDHETHEGDTNQTVDIAEYCDDPQAVERGTITEAEAHSVCLDEQLEAMEGVDPADTVHDAQNTSEEGDDDPPTHDDPADRYEEDEDEDITLPTLPPAEQIAIALAILVGGVASVRRSGVSNRVRYALDIRWQGSQSDPRAATERAWDRLETYLARTYLPRRTGESARSYVQRLDDRYLLDDRVETVLATYERAHYSEESIDRDTARQTVKTVDDVIGDDGTRWSRLR